VDDDDAAMDFAYARRVQEAFAAASLDDPLDDGTCIHHTGVGSQPYSAPEAYYRDLYSYRPYKGAPADLWSCGVILYVLLTGRPPFIRPLTRTYGALKRDKHFIALMKGDFDGRVSEEAKEVIASLLRIHPDDRWGVEQIQRSRWWRGHLMDRAEVVREMRDRMETTYRQQKRDDLIHLLHSLRKEEDAVLSPSPQPDTGRGVRPASTKQSKTGQGVSLTAVDAAVTVHRSSPMAIHSAAVGHSPPRAGPFLQPLGSLSDTPLGVGSASHDGLTSASASLLRQLSASPSPSHSPLSSSDRPIVAALLRDLHHTSTLPSPVHQRHQHFPPAGDAAAAGGAGAGMPPTHPPASTASPLSSSVAYRSFFRSARPPTTQPLSLTAQASLKPTSWGRRDSHSRSASDRSRSTRERGAGTGEAGEEEEGEEEEGEEDTDEWDDDEDGDEDEGGQGVGQDVDAAGYECDSTTSEEVDGDATKDGEHKYGQ
jgi:serine/threonine protein kinase